MSTISASTTTTTAYKVTADTTGTLVLQTGASPTTAVTIDGSQNVNVGTSGGSGQWIGVNTNASSTGFYAYNDTSQTILSSAAAVPMLFKTSNTERMRIDSSGNLLLNTTSQIVTGKMSISFAGASDNGINLKTTYASTGSAFLQFFNSAGTSCGYINQSGTTTTLYSTSSDYRLKENIAPMTGALDKVAQLNPVTYKWKSDGSSGQGFIAHELQAVVPECVYGEKDAVDEKGNPKYQGIDTSFLVATLTAAIQEQQAIIQQLTARIETLEAK